MPRTFTAADRIEIERHSSQHVTQQMIEAGIHANQDFNRQTGSTAALVVAIFDAMNRAKAETVKKPGG